MTTTRMFFTALRIWFVFAAASIVTVSIISVGLAVFSGILASISNPVSFAIDLTIIYLLNHFGWIEKIKRLHLLERLDAFYRWVGRNLEFR